MKNWRGKLTPQFIPRDSIIKKTLPWLAPKHVFYIYVQLGYMHPQLIGERPIRNFLATEIVTNTPWPLLALSLLKNWSWDFPFVLALFIGPRSDHSLRLSGTHWLTDSLTHWRPFGTDVTTLLKMEWIDPCWRNQISKQCWYWNEIEV